MADLAHNASGSTSSEPAGIAVREAGGPTSSDKGKLRVFISYSRDDLDFADQLTAALDFSGFECFIDREGISGGEDWKRSLGGLISEADTVVFVLTPNSARSPICDWEVEEATRLNKRILPIICRPLEGVSPPPRLRELNYIFFYKEPKVPGSGFGTGLAKLVTALNTDFDWLREHTRYFQRAIEWDRGGRPANRLLSGDDIAEAKAWVARRPKSAPEPAALQLDFIRASEEEAAARLSEQRKQLEAMAANQAERERALRVAEEAQHKRAAMARIRNIALVAVSILAVLAGWLGWSAEQKGKLAEQQRITAEEQRKLAEQQRKTAEEQRQQADTILARATIIISKLQDQMDIDTEKEAVAVFKAGAEHGSAASMSNLGLAYDRGIGVTRDYDKAREWYEKAAANGDARGMNGLGQLYSDGRGVLQDYAKAFEWYEKAAVKGRGEAMLIVGFFYANGFGVRQDYAKAREWFEQAVLKGSTEQVREWLADAAKKDVLRAMVSLGELYLSGRGVPLDYAKAREWFEKAAAENNTDAMVNLGDLYADANGVERDYAKAREWFEKAAAQDDARAKMALERLSIREAETAGQYDKALRLEEAFAAKIEADETKREGKPGDETAGELTSVAWYALITKDFTKALTVADRAHALFPNNLMIETNRAHALMFMRHDEEAKALYLADRGKPVSEVDNKLWEQAIAEDFANFRKAGLTNPMMDDIEKELGISR
jgi:TPR repeat protein